MAYFAVKDVIGLIKGGDDRDKVIEKHENGSVLNTAFFGHPEGVGGAVKQNWSLATGDDSGMYLYAAIAIGIVVLLK